MTPLCQVIKVPVSPATPIAAFAFHPPAISPAPKPRAIAEWKVLAMIAAVGQCNRSHLLWMLLILCVCEVQRCPQDRFFSAVSHCHNSFCMLHGYQKQIYIHLGKPYTSMFFCFFHVTIAPAMKKPQLMPPDARFSLHVFLQIAYLLFMQFVECVFHDLFKH